MSKVKKIEDRTRWFIDEYNRLTDSGHMPTNVDLAKILGIKSKSAVTNILKGDQNIQPDSWKKFIEHFNIAGYADSSDKAERAGTSLSQPQILTVLAKAIEKQADAFANQAATLRVQADIMKSIESKMAKETTLAGMESNLKRTLATALTLSKDQQDGMEEIRGLFSQTWPQKNAPSRGSGKGRGRIDGGFEKTGKSPG